MFKLLFIDDSKLDHIILDKIIAGIEAFNPITHSYDGEEALKSFSDNPSDHPDVIFLDIRMPRFDGWDFLQGFNNLQPSLPVKPLLYVFSSSIDPTDRERALSYDFVTGFFSKPVSRPVLEQVLNACIERSKL
ncbi:response regulator [Mucilaginibacter sp. SMC90]|uniref:response regulator n=1 Tax=Mucilaginibacter sp. SMC90 TaxID=2929803 RepID=UPI001FB39C23|nr:response regulator [Mucilaginibacter sp. SMC90]UOE50455.1 response regulator [Mucilaginibacter sp. SMC90]